MQTKCAMTRNVIKIHRLKRRNKYCSVFQTWLLLWYQNLSLNAKLIKNQRRPRSPQHPLGQFRSAFHFAFEWQWYAWDLQLCIFGVDILFTVSYSLILRGFVLAVAILICLVPYFGLFVVFLYLKCENWFKMVVCHSVQFWVCSIHWCTSRGARKKWRACSKY